MLDYKKILSTPARYKFLIGTRRHDNFICPKCGFIIPNNHKDKIVICSKCKSKIRIIRKEDLKNV